MPLLIANIHTRPAAFLPSLINTCIQVLATYLGIRSVSHLFKDDRFGRVQIGYARGN